MVRSYPVTPFGKEIKKRMIDLDMSQNDLAQKMGVSSPYVGEILRGTSNSAYAQRIVCEAVGLDYDELMQRIEKGA